MIEAGTQPTTMSFLYDVVSSSGNTGRGRIVVKVVRESVPDYPVVADTVLTVENRDDFEDGVDVIAGKATWSAGEVDDLAVTLWGDPDGVSVSGHGAERRPACRDPPHPVRRDGRGAHPDRSRATRSSACRVTTTSRSRSAAARRHPEATELASVSFDMATLVARPPATRLEVGDDLRVSGARTEASCVRRRRHHGALRRGRRRPVGRRVPGAGPPRGPGRLDVPVGAHHASSRSTRSPSCTRRRSRSAPARRRPSI